MILAHFTSSTKRCLTRLVQSQHGTSDMGALALPAEIILMIASHLDKISTISFALTCRRLRSLCFPPAPSLNLAEKEKVLILIEQDEPTVNFCLRCAKLHKWHTRWSRSIPSWDIEIRLPCKPYLFDTFYLPPLDLIPYYHARLVMNRHLYGSTHGPPISIFNLRTGSLQDYTYGVMTTITRNARIVEDRLLVLLDITMSHPRAEIASLQCSIDEHYRSLVCPHIGMRPPAQLPRPSAQLPELAASPTSQFRLCEEAFGSCPLCLTDYRIDISWQGAKKGYIIKLFVYRELGDCRSPFEWSWQSGLGVGIDEKL